MSLSAALRPDAERYNAMVRPAAESHGRRAAGAPGEAEEDGGEFDAFAGGMRATAAAAGRAERQPLALSEDLLFYYKLSEEEKQRAREQLRSLLPQVVAAAARGYEHAPILVCGSAPPASGTPAGFA